MNSLISIQILRAVAAWLLVYHHEYALLSIRHFQFNQQLGYFGVDIFFVISGFIMFYSLANREYGAKEFFVKRLIRIVPAYWFYTLLMVLLSWVYAKEFSYTDWNLNTLIASLFFIITKNPSGHIGYFPLLTVGWTLSFEMFFYAWLSLCIFAFGKFRFWACTITLLVLPLIWDKYWIYGLSTKLLYEFAFGIVLAHGYLKLRNARPRLLYVLGIALLSFLALLSQIDINNVDGGMFDLQRSLSACLLISSALCFELALLKIKINAFRLLKYLGDTSYSTYLVHLLVIGVFRHYFGKQDSELGELLLLFTTSLTIFAISHLSYQYIEIGLLFKILKRKLVGVSGLPT